MTIPKLPSYDLPTRSAFPANKTSWRVDPRRAALLIHDMQLYFLDFYGEDSPLVRDLVQAVARLKKLCVERDIPVFYTAQPLGQTPETRGLLNDMWGKGIDQKPERQGIVPALAPTPHDVVLDKWRYSAFQKSDFADRLRDARRDQLIIAGVYGHIGCLMTAANAFMLDIQAFLVGDAIADFSLADHQMAMSYVATRCGQVIGVEEFES